MAKALEVGDKIRCVLHYSGAEHQHDYEILKIGAIDPSRPEYGRPLTVRALGTDEVFGWAHLEGYPHRRLTADEISRGEFL